MKNYLLIGLVISMICFVPACKNPCKDPSWYYPPFQSQLKKYSFEPGSYWVYQDSASGIIDSQTVYYYNAQNHVTVGSGYTGNGGQCDEFGDIFNMGIVSLWNGVVHDSIGLGNNILGFTGSDIIIVYGHPTSESDIYRYSAIGGTGTVTLQNFIVSGQTYPIVYRYISNFNSLMYHVDNVGAIKWVFNDTINGQRTWNLLRYHVINP